MYTQEYNNKSITKDHENANAGDIWHAWWNVWMLRKHSQSE